MTRTFDESDFCQQLLLVSKRPPSRELAHIVLLHEI
jgi:hypothetical protein